MAFPGPDDGRGVAVGLAYAIRADQGARNYQEDAAGATPFLASLLYGVSPLDSITFAAVAALLVAAAAGATYLPARRATRISAASALRADS